MTFEDYKGKKATIKSTEVEGIIDRVRHKRGADGSLGARFIVVDPDGKEHELMPHELIVHKDE
ncbi:MAG TPA: hypothetical protein VL443_24155 [Cyclobacteriaceae bacterium]|jgi:hypothetical protein|nr:hypothetical protein [Cyclobacteriaceae bacterium]